MMQTTIPPVRRFSFHAALLCAALLLCSGALDLVAGPVVKVEETAAKSLSIQDVWSLPGIFGGGMKTTDLYTEGNVFLVLPVISTVGRDGLLSGDVLFIEPYSSWGEQGEVAASLGLGWRHYFTTQSVSAVTKHDGHQAGFFEEGVYLGANIFVDMLDTQFDNQFWQLGVGAEIGTRYLEIRGNYYLPLSDRQLALEQRTQQTFQSSSTSTSQQVTPLSNPYATGNSLAQDVQFTSLTTTTTSTTTIEQLFRLYEEGMEGWDVQASLLVPGLDRWMDVFLIGGYYSFDNQPFGPQTGGTGNVEGWKGGVEVRPVPAVVLNATWYEDERFVGSEWLYGVRLEIPFEMGDLGDGKSFWDRVGAAFTPRRRHLAERLVEPVRRQNSAVKVGNELEEKTEVNTSVKRVTKVVSQTPQQLVLQDDVIFVNNGAPTSTGIEAGSTSGTGTAEQPVDTIQTGTNIAVANSVATNRIWNVYTQGGVDYTMGATVPGGGGVRYIGSHMPMQGGNKSYMTGHIPTILGSLGLQAPNGGTYFGVFGYTFNGGTILAENYNEVEIEGNTLNTPAGTGITVRGSTVTTSNVKVQNNLVNTAIGSGIVITAGGITQMQAEISGNAVQGASAYGIHLQTFDAATLNAEVAGNAITDASLSGMWLNAQNNVPMSEGGLYATVEGNVVSGSGVYGAGIYSYADAVLDVAISGNHFYDNAAYHVRMESFDGSTSDIMIAGNLFEDEGVSAVRQGPFSTLNLTVIGNTFNNGFMEATSPTTMTVTGNAVLDTPLWLPALNVHTYSDTTVVVQDNYITSDAGSGIFLQALDGTMTATVTGNYITDLSSDAISLYSSGAGIMTADVSGNAAIRTATGVAILSENSAPGTGITATVTGNMIQDSIAHGVLAWGYNSSDLDVTFSGNNITGAGGDAVQLVATADAMFDAVVSGNAIYDSRIYGAANTNALTASFTVQDNYISNGSIEGDNVGTFTVSGNAIENSPGNAMSFNYDRSGTLSISNNYITGAGGSGISIFKSMGTDAVVATISGNEILDSASHGITVHTETDGSVDMTIADNLIQNAGGSGILLNSTNDLGGITASVVGNQIQAPVVDGTRVEALNYATVGVTIDSNAIVDAGVNGITLRSEGAANLTAMVSNNYISNAGNTGLQVRSENSVPGTGITVDITGNAILDSGTHGVDLYTSAVDLTATLTGNLIRGTVNYYGTYLHGDGGTVHATITGNNYVDNVNGFHVYADADGANIDAAFEGNYFNNGEVWLDRTDDLAALDLTIRQNHFLNSYLTAWSPTDLTAEGNLFESTGSGYSGLTVFNNMSNSISLVKDNYFTGNSWLYIIANEGTMDITVTGNSFVDTGREGIYLTSSDPATLLADISGNFMSGTTIGVYISPLTFSPQSSTTVTVANNVIQNTSSHGIAFQTFGSGGVDLTITGNHISNTGGDAMNFDAFFSDGANNVLVSGNAIYNRGIFISNNAYAWMHSNFTVQDNYLSQAGIVAVNAHNLLVTGNVIEWAPGPALSFTYDGGGGNVTATGNYIFEAGNEGIYLSKTMGSAPVTATFTGNAIISPSMDGIAVYTQMDGSVDVAIAGNLIQETGRSGIRLNATDMSSITANVAGNQIQAWGGDGITVEAYNDATVGVIIDGNSITESSWNGISLVTNFAANLTATVSNNYISYTNEMGVNVQSGNVFEGTGITVDITGNSILNTGRNAVNILSQPGEVNATVTGNALSNAFHLAYLHSSGGPINATFTGNSFEATSGTHVRMESGDGTINATLAQNLFIYGGISAVRDYEWGTLNLTVQQNHFDNGWIEATNLNTFTMVGNTMEFAWFFSGGLNVNTSMDSTFVVQDNYLSQAGSINIAAHDLATVTATVTGNVILYTQSDAIALQTSGYAHITADISGNAISDAGGSGIYIMQGSGADATSVSLTNNTINGTGSHGIWSQVVGEGSLDMAISNNGIQNATGSGIRLQADNYLEDAGITVSTLDGNYVNQAGENGIAILSADQSDITVSNFNGNIIADTVAGSHLVIEQGAVGMVQVTGALDNTASPSPNPTGATLIFNGTTPTVNFLLNGTLITMPVDMP